MYFLSFSGRCDRYEYWLMLACIFTYSAATTYIIYSTGILNLAHAYGEIFGFEKQTIVTLFIVVNIPSFLIWLSVTIRRYHDREKSGYWCAIILLPILGTVWQFFELGFQPGCGSSNVFGEAPSRITNENNPYRKNYQRKGVGELGELINL